MKRVCAIVVTYNRKQLLLQCLNAILEQSRQVNAMLIVDNASTDNTFEFLQEHGILPQPLQEENSYQVTSVGNIKIYYLRLSSNSGGAGGFHAGLKGALDLKQFDYYWMMDDDGYPSKTCLEQQLAYIDEHHYVMPVSVDITDFTKLSWPVRKKSGPKTIDYAELKESWGKTMDSIFPFNGSLLSQKIVEEVGFPKKELFLWGDEYEHYWRCRKAGYDPITIMDAEFYHPANKMSYEPIIGGLYKVPYTDVDWRFICLVRNSTYIYWNYTGKHRIALKFLVYSYLFLIQKPLSLKKYRLYLNSVNDGIKGRFDRHFLYMK
ncbi:rhamnopyranosyl-N-acetylglucosaminyl-diphospho-decaprenol beta-1,3/1,4-galactofuranosyltransferase [Chitinophaga jiangningensis]|uniref:Rhamnopyranosyl-N-acetylglucosaminyl-diphospho-decaprenol beta-1,3/1,4-galactofuranosyltransferase n=1 Tax=Chitinophaga jiangningensis TaxID=1419482 RepID=A0A1M7HIB7_9BACT|nr:glycosyltransferase [Chitinophaga jiangningensis]SHM28178.1 rhamnopyranosyl-N-acetylglucosaminyl-diphospho-decaprenol beta-1,3/1,4-galactofuranosyltransferase [Chitinophaga jiangningensis]